MHEACIDHHRMCDQLNASGCLLSDWSIDVRWERRHWNFLKKRARMCVCCLYTSIIRRPESLWIWAKQSSQFLCCYVESVTHSLSALARLKCGATRDGCVHWLAFDKKQQELWSLRWSDCSVPTDYMQLTKVSVSYLLSVKNGFPLLTLKEFFKC